MCWKPTGSRADTALNSGPCLEAQLREWTTATKCAGDFPNIQRTTQSANILSSDAALDKEPVRVWVDDIFIAQIMLLAVQPQQDCIFNYYTTFFFTFSSEMKQDSFVLIQHSQMLYRTNKTAENSFYSHLTDFSRSQCNIF